MLPQYRPGQRITTIPLQVELLPTGGLRLSSTAARGWAGVATTPLELARVVDAAFREVSVASYARYKKEPYDLDKLTERVPGDALADRAPRRIRGVRTVRKKSYDVEDWTRLEDGRWRSPSGRAYRADSTAVQNVLKKRAEKGLPTG